MYQKYYTEHWVRRIPKLDASVKLDKVAKLDTSIKLDTALKLDTPLKLDMSLKLDKVLKLDTSPAKIDTVSPFFGVAHMCTNVQKKMPEALAVLKIGIDCSRASLSAFWRPRSVFIH